MALKRKPTTDSAQPQPKGKIARTSIQPLTGTKRKDRSVSTASEDEPRSNLSRRSSQSSSGEDDSTGTPPSPNLRRSSRLSSGEYNDQMSMVPSIFTGDSPTNRTSHVLLGSPLFATTRTTKESQKDQDQLKSHYRKLLEVAYYGGSYNDHLTPKFFDEIKALQDPNDKVALIDKPDKKEDYTPLIYAARNNHPETCQLFIEFGGASINKHAGWNSVTALMKAAEKGYEKVVRKLLELGADPNLKNSRGNSALMLAAEAGKDKVVEALIAHLATNLDERNHSQDTALILAAEGGHKRCTEFLCRTNKRININAKNMSGKSALFMAAEFNRTDVLEVLYKYNADVNSRSATVQFNCKGMTDFMLASLKGHIDVVKCLINKSNIHLECESEDVNGLRENALTLACTQCLETGENGVKGKIKVVKTLLHPAHGTKCPEGCTELDILMKACETSCTIVDILLDWFVRPELFPPEVNKSKILGKKAKKILELLTTPKGKDGTTCLMTAGRKGNIKVMTYLIRTIGRKWDIYYPIRSKNPNDFLTKLLIFYPTRSEFVKACYDKITDREGNTAAMLLATYYKKHSEKFREFITEATKSPKHMYLFDLMPRIVPQISDPNIIVAIFRDELIPQLQKQRGHHADVKLLSVLVNISATLSILTSFWGPLLTQKFGVREFCEDVDKAVEACMLSSSMHKRANVMKVLQDGDSADMDEQAAIICEASAFVNGPLALCIQYNLTALLSTVPIATLVDRVFQTSLRPVRRKYIHGWNDIFQLRSGCTTLRYRPVFMFFIEAVSKLVYLILVAYAPYSFCGFKAACVSPRNFSFVEMCIVVMTISGVLYKIGEMFDRGECDRYGFWQNIPDIWNILDFLGLFCASQWLVCRLNHFHYDSLFLLLARIHIPLYPCLLSYVSSLDSLGHSVNVLSFSSVWILFCASQCLIFWLYHSHDYSGRGFLAWSAIPMSLGLLRFVSSVNFLGHSVNVIYAISSHLLEFFIVFFISMVGFVIAFHSIFSELDAFKSFLKTSLTLFRVALGDHGMLQDGFDEHSYVYVGLITMVLYITFLGIILLNFMIAKMGNTFGDAQFEATKQWSMFMARNVQAWLLIREKSNPLCMLPPPFNVLILFVWPWNAFEWRKKQKEQERLSICGLMSDFFLGLLSSPFLASNEMYLVNREFWLSNVPKMYVNCFWLFSYAFLPSCWLLSSPFLASNEMYLVNREFWLSNVPKMYVNYFWLFFYAFLPSCWFIFWVKICLEVIVHTRNNCVRISNKDNHIIYNEAKVPQRVEEKFIGINLEMKIIEFSLERRKGPFSRTANVYVQATYGNDVQKTDHLQCDHATVFPNHTFKFTLIENGKLKLQVFDNYYNGDINGESAGDSVLFAENDYEDDVKQWIANRRYEGDLILYQSGHTCTKGATIKVAVKIKYERHQPKVVPQHLTRIVGIFAKPKCRLRLLQLAQEARVRLQNAAVNEYGQLKLLSDILALKNLSIHRVPGDGNCLFSSVSHQLYDDASKHAVVRDFCVKYMRRQPDRFSRDKNETETADEYFHRMSQDKQEGGHSELQAIAGKTGRPIHIYRVDANGKAQPNPHIIPHKKTNSRKGADSREPIVLIYSSGNHYDSVKLSAMNAANVSGLMEKENVVSGNDGFIEDDDDLFGNERTEAERDPLYTEEDRNRIFAFLLKPRFDFFLPDVTTYTTYNPIGTSVAVA